MILIYFELQLVVYLLLIRSCMGGAGLEITNNTDFLALEYNKAVAEPKEPQKLMKVKGQQRLVDVVVVNAAQVVIL